MPEERLRFRSGSEEGRHWKTADANRRRAVSDRERRRAAVDPGALAALARAGRRVRRRRYRRGPIFVDSSGRRRRMHRLMAVATSGVLACSGIVLAATMVGSHPRSPVILLPDGPEPEAAAVVPRPEGAMPSASRPAVTSANPVPVSRPATSAKPAPSSVAATASSEPSTIPQAPADQPVQGHRPNRNR